MKEVIATAAAPPALGPYAQAVKVGNQVYVSGQLPLDPRTRLLASDNIGAQTERVMLNIQAILEEAGATMDDVVRMTIYLTNLDDFDEVNRVFAMFFPMTEYSQRLPPARATVEVSRLPKGADIEMDAIAIISSGYVAPELY